MWVHVRTVHVDIHLEWQTYVAYGCNCYMYVCLSACDPV